MKKITGVKSKLRARHKLSLSVVFLLVCLQAFFLSPKAFSQNRILYSSLLILNLADDVKSFQGAQLRSSLGLPRTLQPKTTLYYKDEYNPIAFTYRFRDYLLDVEKMTDHDISELQRHKLMRYVNTNPPKKIQKKFRKQAKKKFTKIKYHLIREWEEHTGYVWPKYPHDVITQSGIVVREKGSYYDAHHILEIQVGGPNHWWNIHPARYPDQHQQGIHRTDGHCSLLFDLDLELFRLDDRMILPII